MKSNFLLSLSFLAMLACTLVLPIRANDTGKKDKDVEPVEAVELFEAMKDGKIEVQLIPKDATQASVVIRNKGDKPLNIKLPATFGAVPVLGQMGMGGMGGGGMGGMGGGGMGGMGGGGMGGMGGGGMGGGGGQGMGGGMGGMGGGGMGGGGMGGGGMGGGGMGGGGMGGGGMGGMFRVNPERPGKFKVPCVCLEHGKQDPNPRMKYKIVQLEELNSDPRVRDLCAVLGQGKVAQNTAQAAAWHIANRMSWEELAHKNRIESQYTGNVRFFNPLELQSAFQLAGMINQEQQLREAASKASPGYSTSTSSENSTADQPNKG